jgi:hypothetical protein
VVELLVNNVVKYCGNLFPEAARNFCIFRLPHYCPSAHLLYFHCNSQNTNVGSNTRIGSTVARVVFFPVPLGFCGVSPKLGFTVPGLGPSWQISALHCKAGPFAGLWVMRFAWIAESLSSVSSPSLGFHRSWAGGIRPWKGI